MITLIPMSDALSEAITKTTHKLNIKSTNQLIVFAILKYILTNDPTTYKEYEQQVIKGYNWDPIL